MSKDEADKILRRILEADFNNEWSRLEKWEQDKEAHQFSPSMQQKLQKALEEMDQHVIEEYHKKILSDKKKATRRRVLFRSLVGLSGSLCAMMLVTLIYTQSGAVAGRQEAQVDSYPEFNVISFKDQEKNAYEFTAPKWVPDGYEFLSERTESDLIQYIYTDQAGNEIRVTENYISSNLTLQFDNEGVEVEEVSIFDLYAGQYITPIDGGKNARLTWNNGQIAYQIEAPMEVSKEVLIQIAESIYS